MTDGAIEEQVRRLADSWQGLNALYEDYARGLGISYTTLQAFSYVATIDGCTQRNICERTFLPRQTVNTIVATLAKRGLVELREKPDDRRVKEIVLTDAGKKLARETVEPLLDAEKDAMAALASEEREQLIALFGKYAAAFNYELDKRKNSGQ